MNRILIIEDEEGISRFLQLELEYEGYKTEKAYDGREGLRLALDEDFDLILLDVMLPGLNGMEVLRRVKKFKDTPVIMLTAKDSTTDKVMGLDIGANDYVTKPFEIEELLARIRAILRNNLKEDPSPSIGRKPVSSGKLLINAQKHEVSYNEEVIPLTKTEYDLLFYLLSNKNITLSREQILENVWGFDYMGDTNLVDVYIRYLRSKIDDKYNIKFIHTIRGVGYIIKDEEEQ
ncbi:MAG: response regulator transcription factor [Clostridia bacterium]|nr:response regulator transcription factor [Clostridia bacterium]